MSEETKNIIAEVELTLDITVKPMVLFQRQHIKQLLDLITNLQQESKIKDTNWESLKYYLQRLFDKDYIEEEIFDDICKKVNELESQIEIKGYQKDIEYLQQRLEDETLCKEIAQGHRDEVRDRESRELEELRLQKLKLEDTKKELIEQDKYIDKLKKEYDNQLQQKENIIKEVREKIEELAEDDGDFIGEIDHNRKQELLEILDKENKDIELDTLKALNTDLDDDVEMG